MISALRSLNDLVDDIKREDLEDMIYGQKKSRQSHSDYRDLFYKKSSSDLQNSQQNHHQDNAYHKNSDKRNLDDEISTYDLKELEDLVNRLLDKK